MENQIFTLTKSDDRRIIVDESEDDFWCSEEEVQNSTTQQKRLKNQEINIWINVLLIVTAIFIFIIFIFYVQNYLEFLKPDHQHLGSYNFKETFENFDIM